MADPWQDVVLLFPPFILINVCKGYSLKLFTVLLLAFTRTSDTSGSVLGASNQVQLGSDAKLMMIIADIHGHFLLFFPGSGCVALLRRTLSQIDLDILTADE